MLIIITIITFYTLLFYTLTLTLGECKVSHPKSHTKEVAKPKFHPCLSVFLGTLCPLYSITCLPLCRTRNRVTSPFPLLPSSPSTLENLATLAHILEKDGSCLPPVTPSAPKTVPPLILSLVFTLLG